MGSLIAVQNYPTSGNLWGVRMTPPLIGPRARFYYLRIPNNLRTYRRG